MSTISDVAKRAGVSAMTVSRVVNGTGYTSAETRARVEAAIEELGYVPNALGPPAAVEAHQDHRAASSRTSPTPSSRPSPAASRTSSSAHGFSVMYCNTDESEAEEEQYLLMLIERQVDGVLLVPARSSGESLPAARSPPHARSSCIDRRVAARNVDSVRCDSEAGAHALAEHLVEPRPPPDRGADRLAATSPPRSTASRAAAAPSRRPASRCPTTLVHYGGFNYGKSNQADGHRMAQRDAGRGRRAPDRHLLRQQLHRLRGDPGAARGGPPRARTTSRVVAFDDLPEEWVSEPFLTVARQPAYEIGHRAAALLLDHITGDQTPVGRIRHPAVRADHPPVERAAHVGRRRAARGPSGCRPVDQGSTRPGAADTARAARARSRSREAGRHGASTREQRIAARRRAHRDAVPSSGSTARRAGMAHASVARVMPRRSPGLRWREGRRPSSTVVSRVPDGSMA